jgi:hypothetical protein
MDVSIHVFVTSALVAGECQITILYIKIYVDKILKTKKQKYLRGVNRRSSSVYVMSKLRPSRLRTPS